MWKRNYRQVSHSRIFDWKGLSYLLRLLRTDHFQPHRLNQHGDSSSLIWVLPSPVHLPAAPPSLLPAYLFPARVQITGKLPFISQYPISATAAAAHSTTRERDPGNEECAMNGLVGSPRSLVYLRRCDTFADSKKAQRPTNDAGIRDAIDIRSQPR